MQIVIEISDKVYGLLKYFEKAMGLVDKKEEDDDVKTALMRAVVKGTLLPKHHGRLVDVSDLYAHIHVAEYDGACFPYVYCDDIASAPAIIEADKAESEVEE